MAAVARATAAGEAEQGLFGLTLFGLTVAAGSAIYFTQRRRYRRSAAGIKAEQLAPDIAAAFWTAGACVALGPRAYGWCWSEVLATRRVPETRTQDGVSPSVSPSSCK